jgi:hypothetical protein
MSAMSRKRSSSQGVDFQLTVALSGKRSLRNSTPKYYNLVRSKDVLYIDRFTIILFIVDDPLSELGQKTDSLCLPNLELLSCAIADLPSGLANLVDLSCLLICDRTQITSSDSMGDIGTYNVAHHPPQITFASQPIDSRRSVCMGVVSL